MSSKKIDQLFRSKLEGYTVAPSEQAWSKLQGKMKPTSKAPVLWMQIAAAVLLLLVGGWFLLRDESSAKAGEGVLADQSNLKEKEKAAQEENREILIPAHPIDEEKPAVAKNKDEESTAPARAVKKNKAPQPARIEVASAEEQPQKMEVPVTIADFEKAQTGAPAGAPEISLPENLQPEEMETQIAAATETKVPAQEVKITYIADNDDRFLEPVRELLESDKQKDKKSGFSKLIASAKNISGGDLLADIRESKDELFNGNLKLNREGKVKTQNK